MSPRTVGEAQNSWCPFSRAKKAYGDYEPPQMYFVEKGGVAFNRPPTGDTLCIGPTCMAWRWAASEHESQIVSGPKTKPKGDGWERIDDATRRAFDEYKWIRKRPDRRGYCGAFGPPA